MAYWKGYDRQRMGHSCGRGARAEKGVAQSCGIARGGCANSLKIFWVAGSMASWGCVKCLVVACEGFGFVVEFLDCVFVGVVFWATLGSFMG